MAHLVFLIGAGIGVGIVDPFAPQRMSAARLHPRRDDDGHDDGNAVDDNTDDDSGTDDTDTSDDDKPKDDADTKSKDDTDWKAMARKHEREAKANRAAAAELEKIKAKNRPAEENAQKAAEEAAKERDAAKAEAAIERAARKHGLTDDKDLELLQGLPADKIDAVAKALSAGKKPAGSSGREATGSKKTTKPTTLTGVIGAHYS